MGPRLVSRGKRPNRKARQRTTFASMGPRLVSRGKEANRTVCGPTEHRFNGAATC